MNKLVFVAITALVVVFYVASLVSSKKAWECAGGCAFLYPLYY